MRAFPSQSMRIILQPPSPPSARTSLILAVFGTELYELLYGAWGVLTWRISRGLGDPPVEELRFSRSGLLSSGEANHTPSWIPAGTFDWWNGPDVFTLCDHTPVRKRISML